MKERRSLHGASARRLRSTEGADLVATRSQPSNLERRGSPKETEDATMGEAESNQKSLSVPASLEEGPNRPSESTTRRTVQTRGSRSPAVNVAQEANGGAKGTVSHISTRRSSGIGETEAIQKEIGKHHPDRLIAVESKSGGFVSSYVKLSIDGAEYIHDSPSDSQQKTFLGHDGNQYYCDVCKTVGDVVCCDGCPKVYHQACIPVGSPARVALDNDEEPWYCPHCQKQQESPEKSPRASLDRSSRGSNRGDKTDRRSTSHNCVDCGKDLDGHTIEPCSGCGHRVHNPPCGDGVSVSKGAVLCSTCRAVDNLTKEEDDMNKSLTPERDLLKVSTRVVPHRGEERTREDQQAHRSPRRRTRTNSMDVHTPKSSDKRATKKRKTHSFATPPSSSEHNVRGDTEEPDPGLPDASPYESFRALPAFYFYLAENRWKIERSLARKHRFFNRLPKGKDRNEVVAREGALWWVKLRPTDHRRYMTMSMRDFESRIVDWKEDRNLREMVDDDSEQDPEDGTVEAPTRSPKSSTVDDDRRDLLRHQRRLNSTSVGSKPFKKEPEHSYNRVLLDLLHDMRFHPDPMIVMNREVPKEESEDSQHRPTVPFFEVHGPVSTSLGDECLGCSRGWRHFCPVLKRSLPAVEERAKLQPPLSSLLATRIGLGLRPRLERMEESDNEEVSATTVPTEKPIFTSWQSSMESQEMNRLPIVPCATLQNASDRIDDITYVVEETNAMIVKEPSRRDDGRSSPTWHKCGRCRTLTENERGCLQCRRAQLVINMTKTNSKANDKMLKAQTVMLGRVQVKDSCGEEQSKGDQAVSQAILRQRWAPMVVLASGSPFSDPILDQDSEEEPRADDEEDDANDDDDEEEEEKEDEGEFEEVVETMSLEPEDSSSTSDNKMSMDTVEADDGNETNRDKRKRQQPARLMVSSASTKDYNEPESNDVAHMNSSAATEIVENCVWASCTGIMCAAVRRDPLRLFSDAIADKEFEKETADLVTLSTIRRHVLENQYSAVNTLVSDMSHFCDKALSFFPEHSVQWKTAGAIKETARAGLQRSTTFITKVKEQVQALQGKDEESEIGLDSSAILEALRESNPELVRVINSCDQFRKVLGSDIPRTEENELAYFGAVAIKRAAVAAASSLAPYTDSNGKYGVVPRRDHSADADLREFIDDDVTALSDAVQLSDVSSGREEAIVKLLRKVQSRRAERVTIAESGCTRCTGYSPAVPEPVDEDLFHADKRTKKAGAEIDRLTASREYLATGLGSAQTCKRIVSQEETDNTTTDTCVDVRPSKIHGMGLFSGQPFKKNATLIQYTGDYISVDEADKREAHYSGKRRQHYIYRVDEKCAVDATMRGGPARFINHKCEPNCYVVLSPFSPPHELYERVMVVASRDIEINEELTLDYRIPLVSDLKSRIPCRCQADACRGFLNWKLPETGSNTRALLVYKRGANMRDRIRRLRRPLKRDDM